MSFDLKNIFSKINEGTSNMRTVLTFNKGQWVINVSASNSVCYVRGEIFINHAVFVEDRDELILKVSMERPDEMTIERVFLNEKDLEELFKEIWELDEKMTKIANCYSELLLSFESD